MNIIIQQTVVCLPLSLVLIVASVMTKLSTLIINPYFISFIIFTIAPCLLSIILIMVLISFFSNDIDNKMKYYRPIYIQIVFFTSIGIISYICQLNTLIYLTYDKSLFIMSATTFSVLTLFVIINLIYSIIVYNVKRNK